MPAFSIPLRVVETLGTLDHRFFAAFNRLFRMLPLEQSEGAGFDLRLMHGARICLFLWV